MNEVNYTIQRGEDWKRLFLIKDRRTRRKRIPTQVDATILIDGIKYVLPTEVTTEGGVLLKLTPNNTEWLPNGTFLWDSVATISASPLLTSTPLEETVVTQGTLTVTTYDNLTPLASDSSPEALATRDGSWPLAFDFGQPIQIGFDFAPVDISTWTWIGHAYVDEFMNIPVGGTFIFTNPVETEVIATLATVLPIGTWWYSIAQTSPEEKPMVSGRLLIQ